MKRDTGESTLKVVTRMKFKLNSQKWIVVQNLAHDIK